MNPKIASHYRLQYEEASACYVLLYPEGLVELSESAAEILLLCDGKHTKEQIVTLLCEKYEDAQVQHDIEEFLRVASEHGWVKDV